MSQKVQIFRPARNAMQSGRANTRTWVLEFEPSMRTSIDPLMGWSGSGDTVTQMRLRFDTAEEAVSYAERNGLAYIVHQPRERLIKPKSYAGNFSATRIL